VNFRFIFISILSLLFVSGCGSERLPFVELASAQTDPPKVSPDDTAFFTSASGRVWKSPSPILASDGKVHLIYELLFSNRALQELAPTRITVRAESETGPVLQELTGDGIFSRLTLLQSPRLSGNALQGVTELANAQEAILFFDVTLEPDQQVPRRIFHVLELKDDEKPLTVIEGEVVQPTPIILGRPLAGSGWANYNGAADFPSAHRRVPRFIEGQIYFPERSAIDWIKLDDDGKLFAGNDKFDLDSWYSFGEPVYSTSSGIVSRVVDGLENNRIDEHPVPRLKDGGGNTVIVYMGNGVYVMYGHLQPGLAWKEGDLIAKGDVIGKLGNTGVSGAPHLHFQVMDGNSIGVCEGLVFGFEEFRLEGDFADFDGSDTEYIVNFEERRFPNPQTFNNALPLENTIIGFP
jgi:Peptidase family M23